jgi:hypothetical protein
MFTLTIPDLDVTTGSIPIAWCLDIEAVNSMMITYNKEPSVLIVIASQNGYARRKESRYVVPLKDLMTYISFRRPGPNKIFAMVFNSDIKDLRKKYLGKYDDKYIYDVLNYEGDNFADCGDSSYTNYFNLSKFRAVIDVEVPEEAFAPPPSKWEKDWVLWLVQDKGADQCAFRKRKIFAYTIQPVLFILNYLIRVFATFLSASLLLRSCNLSFLKSPLQTSTFDLIELFEGRSLFFGKNIRTDYSDVESFKNYLIYYKIKFLKYVGLPFLPLSLLIMTVIVKFFSIKIVGIIFATLAAIAGLFFVVGIIFTAFCKAIDWFISFRNKPKKQKVVKEEKEELPKSIFTAKDIEYITCNPVNTQPSYVKIESLPAKKEISKA